MIGKKIVIRRKMIELASLHPDRPALLIGRSPACNVVLRARGIRPVHFLLRWAGQGDFDPKSGRWLLSLIPEGHNEIEALELTQASGLAIEDKIVELDGFTFAWEADRLSSANLSPGLIRRQVEREVPAIGLTYKDVCIEVIRLAPDGQTVVDIEHLEKDRMGASRILRTDRALKIRWTEDLPTVNWSESTMAEKSKELALNELLRLYNGPRGYFVRLVPRVVAPKVRRELFTDPFYRWSLVAILASAIALLMVPSLRRPEIEPIQSRPRIATVMVKEVKSKPAPEPVAAPPPPAPKPEPAPEPKPVEPPPPPVLKKSVSGAAKKKTPRAPVNMNNIGLFAAASAPKQGVSADQLMDQAPAVKKSPKKQEALLTAEIGHIVSAPPTANAPDGNALENAVSKGSDQKTFALNRNGPLQRARAANWGVFNDELSADAESVTGGLDRATERKVLAEHLPQLRDCYRRASMSRPQLEGRMSLRWYISPEGSVSSIQVESSDLNYPQLEGCMMNLVKGIRFPKAANGKETKVIFPFIFRAPTVAE